MKKFLVVLLAVALATPLAAETWKGAALVDAGCASKAAVTEHSENHPTACALRCGKSGYGILVDGKFVKFDEKGNELAAAALKKTDKKDHLTVTIEGEKTADGSVRVTSLALD
jgi:ABC-type oligopeptide transport system substrate-binding subunit